MYCQNILSVLEQGQIINMKFFTKLLQIQSFGKRRRSYPCFVAVLNCWALEFEQYDFQVSTSTVANLQQSSMYNYQTFLREQSLQKHLQSLKKDHQTCQLKRQHSSPLLAQAHKKRVEGFILSVIDKPINVSQYKNESPSFRSTSNQRILGPKGFYLRRQSQPERIQNQLKKNAQLDQVPFTNTYSHKFRESEGKGMHYASFTHNLRVKEYLDRHQLNYLPNTNNKPDKLLKKLKKGQKVDLQQLNTAVNKSLLPMLHQKTYFKSVSTLLNQVPAKNDIPSSAMISYQGNEQFQQHRGLGKFNLGSRKQNPRDALIKCNMLKEKLRG